MHTYLYQKWDKMTEINDENSAEILIVFLKLLVMNDFFFVYAKKASLQGGERTLLQSIINCAIPSVIQFILSILIFSPIEIHCYHKTFLFIKSIWITMNCIKFVVIFNQTKFVSDLIKLVDTAWIINIILIAITDPIENTKERPNSVTFYEAYFRYMEFHIFHIYV